MSMISATYTVDTVPGLPFRVLGNRYLPSCERNSGYTLVFCHAAGLHKETYEPTIEALFEASASSCSNVVREIWVIECPNHGESAVVNHDVLQRDYAENWDGYFYGRCAHAFLTSKPGGIDLQARKLIVAGHSFGGNAAILLPSMSPRLDIASVILLDGAIGGDWRMRYYMDTVLTQFVWMKQDVWRSREDALKRLSKDPTYKTWDPRVIELFAKHALIPHPASKFPPPFQFNGVTLACKKDYEAACFRTRNHHVECWERLLDAYDQDPPVHMILSEKDEFDGLQLKEAQLHGRNDNGPASVQWIENVTHMFVQQRPAETARAIWKAISGVPYDAHMSRF